MTRVERDVASDLDDAILEMARDARETGAMNEAVFERITMRQVGRTGVPSAQPLTGRDILALRERANMSRTVFARWLNVTPSHLSRLERGIKRPSGPALVLLNVIRRHGMAPVMDGDLPRTTGEVRRA